MSLLCFEDVNHLLLWLLASIISVSLYASIEELSQSQVRWLLDDGDKFIKYPKRDASSNVSQPKVVIIFVGGLTEGDLINLVPSNVQLRKVMSKDGVWGVMTASDSGSNQNGLLQMFTGNDEGVGPSVLASFDRVTAIGDPAVAQKLNIPQEKASSFRLIDPMVEKQGFVESTSDGSTVDIVVDLAKRYELWSEMEYSEALLIFLGPNDWPQRVDGSYVKFTNLKKAFRHLDTVLSILAHYSNQLQLTYCVTSIGQTVPIIAWGRRIREASILESMLPGMVKSVPSMPKNMKAASFAPLLACLVGKSPPLNSIAQLPSDYLNEPEVCHLRTARRIRHLLKEQKIGVVLGWIFSTEQIITVEDTESAIREIERLFDNADSVNAGSFAEQLVKKCVATIRHFAEVRSHFLSHIIFFTIIGCTVFGLVFVCLEIDRDLNDLALNERIKWLLPNLKQIRSTDVFFTLLLISCIALTAIDHIKWQCFLYATNVVIPWWLACRNFKILKVLLRFNHPQRRLRSGRRVVDVFFVLVIGVIGILIAFRRPAILFFVISMVFLCLLCVVTSMKLKLSLWLFSSIPLIALLSIVDGSNPNETIYLLAGSGWIILPWLFAYNIKMKLHDYIILASSTAIIAIILLFPSRITKSSMFSFFVVCSNLILLPLTGSSKLVPRLLQTFVSMAALFLLLSSNGEPIFLMYFTIHLYCWMIAESLIDHKDLLLEPVKPEGQPAEKINSSDLRKNFFFNIYSLLSASVSGETQECQYCSRTSSAFTRFFTTDLKWFVPVFFAAFIYNYILRRTGSHTYIALLLSFIHFSFFALAAYWNVYEFAWIGDKPTVHELEPVLTIMKLWCIVLVCFWIASLLSCASVLERFTKRRANGQDDVERCRQN